MQQAYHTSQSVSQHTPHLEHVFLPHFLEWNGVRFSIPFWPWLGLNFQFLLSCATIFFWFTEHQLITILDAVVSKLVQSEVLDFAVLSV